MQVVEPALGWYWPSAQLVQALAPTAEIFPARQLEQSDPPTVARNVPAEQFEHSVDPALEYVPSAQSAQLVDAVAPLIVRYVPAAQIKQLTAPVLGS